MTLAPGATIGPYRIVEPLGHGGMATVYKAHQPSLDRDVALKVLWPGYEQDPDFRERFEREAKAIARLRHPHIVQVFDFVVADGHYALAMEYLDGGTLKDRLAGLVARGARMDAAETVRVVGEVAEALDYAHEQGVIHRDVKPSNVMLTRKDWAVVTDFGIARILGTTSHTQTGVGIGTPEYMAPEQGQGARIDRRADIYSLGVTAYEMLVGRVPFTADTPLAVVLAHIKDPLPAPSAVDPTTGPALERALVRALEKEPAARYESAGAFAAALRDALGRDSATATLPTVVTAKPSGRPATESAVRAGTHTVATPIRTSLPRGALLALVAVAAVTIGVVTGQVVRTTPSGGSTASPTATAAASASTVVPSPVLPARGAALFAAKLDGTTADLADIRANPGPADAGFRALAGAIEVFARRADAAASADLAVPPPVPLSYVGELELAVTPGSDVDVNWTIRGTASERAPRYLLQLRTKEQVLQLLYLSGAERATLTEPITLAVQSGQRVTLAVVLDGLRIRVYVNGREVGQVTDQRVSSATGRPNIDIFGHGSGGSFQITGLRLYALP